MRVALTGATGLVGRHLVPLLRERGHVVRALARPRPERDLPPSDGQPWGGVEWIAGRMEEPEVLVRLCEGADAIIHLAFEHPDQAEPDGASVAERYVHANIVPTLALVEAVPGLGAKQFIYASSLAVFGHDPNEDPRGERFVRDEDFPLWPIHFYGATRAAIEKWIIAASHSWSLNASAWRFGLVLGQREYGPETPFAMTVREAREHGEIRTSHGAYCIAVQDAAAILADALGDEEVFGGVYNTFDRWIDFAETAPQLARLVGHEIKVACEPAREPRSPIKNDRLRQRYPRFHTDACVSELLERLVREQG